MSQTYKEVLSLLQQMELNNIDICRFMSTCVLLVQFVVQLLAGRSFMHLTSDLIVAGTSYREPIPKFITQFHIQ